MQRLPTEFLQAATTALDSTGLLGPLSVLIVEPDLEELLSLVAVLSGAGFDVTAAQSFEEARPFVGSRPPSILLTAVRLGIYNGLHLVVRGRAVRPDMAALLVVPTSDPVLQTEADALGVTFLVRPITPRDLVGAVLQTVFRRDPGGPPIRPPFERRVADRRTVVQTVGAERRRVERRRVLPWLVAPRTRHDC